MYKLSFLFNRGEIIIKSLFDIFIIIFFFILRNNLNNQLFINCLFFSFYWIIFSYILGRYHNNTIGSNSKLKFIFRDLLLYILTICIFKIKIFEIFDVTINYFPILIISLSSFFCQLSIDNYFSKGKSKENLLFFGSEESLLLIKNQLKLLSSKSKIFHVSNNSQDINLINDYCLRSKIIIIEEINQLSLEKINLINLERIQNKKKVFSILTWFEFIGDRLPISLLKSNNIIFDEILKNQSTLQKRIKRLADIFISIAILIASAPIIFLSSISIYSEDGFPIFYKQTRSGLMSKHFDIFKLRTMKKNSEENGPQWASQKDSRITRTGRVLRKLRFDELPQLINVIRGEMSLIGPRPERPEIDILLAKEISYYDYKYSVKPGLSGWAQVNYPYGASIEDAKNKLSFDLFYIKNFSIILDFIIFIKTIKLICNAQGSDPNIQIKK